MTKKPVKDNKPTKMLKTKEPITKTGDLHPQPSTPRLTPSMKYLLGFAVALALIGAYAYNRYYSIASVNGEGISRLAYYQALDRQYGKQTLDNMVTEKLINQEAAKANLDIPQEKIDAEIAGIESNLAAQDQNLDDALLIEGMTREDLTNQIVTKLKVEALGSSDAEVTQEQIDEFLEQNKDFLPEDLDEAGREDLAREQLESQSGSQNIQAWLDSVKASAQIIYY
jgi:foldase protein PrsA